MRTARRRTGPDSIWASYEVTSRSYDYDAECRQLAPYLHAELSPVSRLRIDAGAPRPRTITPRRRSRT